MEASKDISKDPDISPEHKGKADWVSVVSRMHSRLGELIKCKQQLNMLISSVLEAETLESLLAQRYKERLPLLFLTKAGFVRRSYLEKFNPYICLNNDYNYSSYAEFLPRDRPCPLSIDIEAEAFKSQRFKIFSEYTAPKDSKYFSCTCMSAPWFVHDKLSPRNNGDIFALGLRKDLQIQEGTTLTQIDSNVIVSATQKNGNHVRGAIAYVLYYFVKTDTGRECVVTEIQSDTYNMLRKTSSLREYFKGWSQQLLTLFEDFLSGLPDEERPDRIRIVGEDFLTRRWPQEDFVNRHGVSVGFKGVGEDVRRMLYRDLPRKMKYQEVDSVIPLSELYIDEVPITTAWVKELETNLQFGLPGCIAKEEINFFDVLSENEVEIIKNHVIPWDDAPIANIDGCIDYYGISDAAELPLTKLLSSELEFLQFIEAFCRSSVGGLEGIDAIKYKALVCREDEAITISESLEERVSGDDIEFILRTRERSRVHCRKGVDGSITLKGCGMVVHSETPELVTPESDYGHPFLLKNWKSGSEIIPSQFVWGGMTFREAHTEFENLINIWMYAAHAGFFPSVSFPVSLMIPLRFRIGGDREDILTLTLSEYQERVLKGFNFIPTVLSTSSQLDLRVNDIFYDIFNHTEEESFNVGMIERKIKTLLECVYEQYGEKLVLPNVLLEPDDNNEVTQSSILKYLHHIGAVNKRSIERILKEYEERVISTTGFVHGMGGNFGGYDIPSGVVVHLYSHVGSSEFAHEKTYTRDRNIGAIGGGATYPRNVDVCGCLHDIDWQCIIPDFYSARKNKAFSENRKEIIANPKHIESMYADIWGVQESILMMKLILKGLLVGPIDPIQDGFTGVPMSKKAHPSVEDDKIIGRVEGIIVDRFGSLALNFLNPRNIKSYLSAYKKGYRIVGQYGDSYDKTMRAAMKTKKQNQTS